MRRLQLVSSQRSSQRDCAAEAALWLRSLVAAPSLLLILCAWIITGCGTGQHGTAAVAVVPQVTGSLQGTSFGGRQPISGALIQLWQTGTTAYQESSSTPLAATTTSTTGSFNFASFSCTPGTELYVTSVGGNPGDGINNLAVLAAGLTSCSNIASITQVNINEVTTLVTGYALQAFATDTNAGTISIGAPPSNQAGLAQAFADIETLVSLSTGTPVASTSTVVRPVALINTLADALAQCVNTPGGDPTRCNTLFGYTIDLSGNPAIDTFSAALNMARNPGANATNIVAFAGSTGIPYMPVVSETPIDISMGIVYTGSGISQPDGIAVDGGGNVWVANAKSNAVTELTHTGTVLSGTSGYTAGSLNSPYALAIDGAGNIWVANHGNSTITELTSSGANVSGSPYSGGGLSSPTAIAVDPSGYIWVSNGGSSSISEFSSTGSPISGTSGYATGSTADMLSVAISAH